MNPLTDGTKYSCQGRRDSQDWTSPARGSFSDVFVLNTVIRRSPFTTALSRRSTMLVSPLFRVTSSMIALLLATQLSVRPVAALCNLSATIECCELVLPANDPVSALVLSLASIQTPLVPTTPVGIACNPFSSTSATWYIFPLVNCIIFTLTGRSVVAQTLSDVITNPIVCLRYFLHQGNSQDPLLAAIGVGCGLHLQITT